MKRLTLLRTERLMDIAMDKDKHFEYPESMPLHLIETGGFLYVFGEITVSESKT